MTGNLPNFEIGSNAPATPPVTVQLAPYQNPKSKPLDDSCLMVHNKQTGASWYVMRFKDRDSMLTYAAKRNSVDDGLYGLPYENEALTL